MAVTLFKLETNLLLVLYLLHFLKVNDGEELKCGTDKDCKGEAGGMNCAYCIESQCRLVDGEIFANFPCTFRTHCSDTECQGPQTVKYEGYGECVCVCRGRYGVRCTHSCPSTAPKYPVGVQLITPTHVVFNRPAPLVVIVSDGPEDGAVLRIQDPSGGYLVQATEPKSVGYKWKEEECLEFLAEDSFSNYLDRRVCSTTAWRYAYVVFVLTFVIPYDFKTPPGQRITSFTRQINMDVYHPQIPRLKVSSHSHKYHMNYPDHLKASITPILKISNCGETLSTAIVYKHCDTVKITANVFYFDESTFSLVKNPGLRQKTEVRVYVEFYQLEGDTVAFAFLKTRYWESGLVTEYYMNPYTLCGTYVVNGSLRQNQFVEFPPSLKFEENFNIAFFKVESSPLKAVIVGGSSRSVYKTIGVVLDGSKSTNPNVPPDKKSVLRFKFTCNWTEVVCRPFTADATYVIEPGVLQSRRAYNFTMRVTAEDNEKGTVECEGVKPAFASQIIEVYDLKTPSVIDSIRIDCVYNCAAKTNPKDIVCLRVAGDWTVLVSLAFEWSQYMYDASYAFKESPVDPIRQNDTASFILIINEDALKENSTFEFKAKLKNTPQYAMYPIITTSSSTLSCRIAPESGEAGTTMFSLSCPTTNTSKEVSKSLEFYDKHKTDGPYFSGRMIGSQVTGNSDFLLTRGTLEVHSYDEYGTATVVTLDVKLSKNTRTIADIELMLADLLKLQDTHVSLETASVISDLFSALQKNATSGEDTYDTLVRFLSTLPIKSYDNAKLGVSTLHVTLLAARGSLSLDSALHAAHTIHTLTKVLAVGLKGGNLCTFRVLYQMFSRILDCLYVVLEVEEKYVSDESASLRFSDPVTYTRVKEISQYLMKTSFLLKSVLAYRHLPAQKLKLIESGLGNLSLWIKVDLPAALSKYTEKEHREKMFPVIIPGDLAEYVKSKRFYLALQFLSYRRDPTWSARTNTEDVLDVSICLKRNDSHTCYFPKVLRHSIRVAFAISNLISQVRFENVTLKRLDPNLNLDTLDVELPVYKIDPPPSANVEAHFNFKGNNTEIYVLVVQGKRPTYEALLVKENLKITQTNSVFPVVTGSSDELHLYYMAIQPGAQVQPKGKVSFDMKIYSKICYTWHNQWGSRGCRIKPVPDNGILICECNRLSLIGGLVQDVKYSLDTVEDLPLYLTVDDATNAARLLFLILLLLVFLFLALICIRADRYDRSKRFVSILPDNFPGEAYGLLVRVVTGARIGAGTDAVVGISIIGSRNDSRSHILSSATHDVMEGMGEDWFLFYSPVPLGSITCLNLWHDNTGINPAWFCDSVTIYDLYHRDCYFFVVNDWITLGFKRFPHVSLTPTLVSEIMSPTRVFLDYFKSGFLLSHVWFDTIARHPRDPVSRTDRLAIVLCFILVSMAVSITLIVESDKYTEEDEFSYSLTWTMLEMSVYTCIPATVITCVLMRMFRTVYEIVFYVERDYEDFSNERRVTRVSLNEDYFSSPSTTSLDDTRNHIHYGRRHKGLHTLRKTTLAEAVNLALMPKPLVPVQIEGDAPNVIIRKSWLLIAWTIVLVIIVICVILSLFLSKNLPRVKTMKWLTVVVFSILIHAFIILPFKITFVSALLAVAFKRIIYKDVYTFDPYVGRQTEHYGRVRYLANLVQLRSMPMYQPLHEVFRDAHRQRMLRAANRRCLYELVVQIVFLVVLGTLLGAHIATRYHTNSHMLSLTADLDKVFNTTEYLLYLQDHCEPYIFKYLWYNWELLSRGHELNLFRKDWMYDDVNRMIGKVRLRQFRVNPNYCEASVNLSTDCAAPFSRRAEDTRDYLPFWTEQNDTNKINEGIGIQLLNKWSYHKPSRDSNFFYDGKTRQTYPSGGYTWDLGSSSDEMEASFAILLDQGWIGHYTRAVLAQVNVYNVNTRMFSEIALVSEQTVAGQILTATVAHSVDIDVKLDWWLTIFIFFAFMLCVRVYLLADFVGVLGLFAKWRGPYELLMALVALAFLFYLLLHLLIVPRYVSDYQLDSDEQEAFDFYKTAHYAFTARALLCTLYVLNLIRFYSLWRFGKNVLRIFFSVIRSIRILICVTVVLVLFQILLFRLVGYLLPIFSDVVFNPNMFYKCNYSYCAVGNEMNGYKIFCFVTSFASAIALIVFFCILAFNYKTARDEVARHWNTVNYFKFMQSEITEMLKAPVVRRTTLKFARSMEAWHREKRR